MAPAGAATPAAAMISALMAGAYLQASITIPPGLSVDVEGYADPASYEHWELDPGNEKVLLVAIDNQRARGTSYLTIPDSYFDQVKVEDDGHGWMLRYDHHGAKGVVRVRPAPCDRAA